MDGGCAQGEEGDAVQLLELEVYIERTVGDVRCGEVSSVSGHQ